MTAALLNQSSLELLRETIAAELDAAIAPLLSAEVQDAGEFVLFSVEMDEGKMPWAPSAQIQFLERATQILNDRLMPREGDYRWMINIKSAGIVIDSAFGGWVGMPSAIDL